MIVQACKVDESKIMFLFELVVRSLFAQISELLKKASMEDWEVGSLESVLKQVLYIMPINI